MIDTPHIPLQVSGNCVIASIQWDLTPEVLDRLRADVLELVRGRQARAVILDVSGLELIDSDDFQGLKQIMRMTRVMGARPILCGLGPGVVSALVQMGSDVEDVEAALNLDEALRLTRPPPPPPNHSA